MFCFDLKDSDSDHLLKCKIMNQPKLVQEVICSLNEMVDQKRKELAKTYYPTKMKVLGVTVPNIRILIKQLGPDLKNMTASQKINFCKDLVHTNIFECQQIGYELIGKNKTLMNLITIEDIIQLDVNQDNWVSVDTFSGLILGVAWRKGVIADDEIFLKARSSDFWIRRQSIVATLGWNQKARGGTGNSNKTLQICGLFVDDHHDMINKALSWALRELCKVDRQPVIDFMNEHDDKLAGRVKREVWNKLNTGLKN